jgi:hypothetical protein
LFAPQAGQPGDAGGCAHQTERFNEQRRISLKFSQSPRLGRKLLKYINIHEWDEMMQLHKSVARSQKFGRESFHRHQLQRVAKPVDGAHRVP